MTKNVFKKLGFIRIAFAASVGFPLLIVTSATAQDPTPTPGIAEAARVIVVGSNLPTTETESALPVTTYTAEIMEKAGANTPAESLRQLPSFVGNTVTENDSNGGDGTAAVNLRALGPNNTLTLINGRRAFLNVGGVNFTNINAIPIGAVERVEVLQDGASSVYGTDAVAGVVNFVLLNGGGNSNIGQSAYEGAQVYGLYGNTTDHDARVLQGWVKGGVQALDGKVAIAAVGEYYDRNDIYSRDRDIAAVADRRFLGGNNQGSPTFSGRAQFSLLDTGGGGNQQSILILNTQNDPDSRADYRSFVAGDDAESFNFRLYTPAIAGMEKAHYYVTGRYKIFDDMLVMYGDILYTKQKQDNGLAPAPFALGSTLNTREPNLSVFNPFVTNTGNGPLVDGTPATSADNVLKQTRYRLVQELGNRRSFFDYDYYRYTVGFNGDFNIKDNDLVSNWGYDAGFVYHRSDQLEIDSGDARRSVIVNALNPLTSTVFDAAGNPVLFNPFIGQAAPTSGTVPTYANSENTPGGGPGGKQTGVGFYDNQAVVDAAAYIGHSYFHERDYLYDIKVFGNLFPNLYQGGVGATFGYAHQNSATHSIPDPVQVAGDQLGFNASSLTKYLAETDSFFGELRVPLIVSTQNIPWMRAVEVGFAYRFEAFEFTDQLGPGRSQIDNGGDPRISIRIQPIEDLVLRGSWSKSFIAPLPFELFDPVQQNFPEVVDSATDGHATSGGAPFQPPEGVFQAGNPALQPEESDSYSVGFVWTPKFVRDHTGGTFTLTTTFYQIFTSSLILGAADFAQLMLTLNGNDEPTHSVFNDTDGPGGGVFDVDGDGSLANNGPGLGITRDAGGDVIAIDSAVFNAGKRLVNGMDIQAFYQLPTVNWGQFTWTLGYNYFFTWKASTGPGQPFVSYLGDFTSSIPLTPGALPYHKGFLRGEWEWRGWDFVMTGNYISSFWDDPQAAPGFPDTEDPNDPFRRVNDYITLDMQLSYTFHKPVVEAVATSYSKDAKDAKSVMPTPAGADNGTFAQRMLWNTKITVGVNNAFDRNPPTVLGAFNDNYDTSLYTIRNRYWYASITKNF